MKAAIFDLDGTIADTMGVWARIDAEFFRLHGMAEPPDYQNAIKTMDFDRAAAYTKARFGFSDSQAEIVAQWREMAVHAYANRVALKNGAAGFIRALAARGFKIGLATASGSELYEPLLARCGILGCFDACVTTVEAGRDKNFPDVYLLCARRLGVEVRRCVVFEDILAGVRAAKSAGMRAVGVYDSRAAHERAAIQEEADAFIGDFEAALLNLRFDEGRVTDARS